MTTKIKIQSISDVITNSSTEIYTVWDRNKIEKTIKDMVNSIITTTYGTKTYVENLTVYKQCLLILKQVDEMLKGLNTGKPKENG